MMSGQLIQHIADEIGVSKRTVSRILNGQYKGNRPSMQRRVKQVQEMAKTYRPNAAARAVRTGRFDNVTILQASGRWKHGIPERTMDAVLEVFNEKGIRLGMARVSDEKLTDSQYIPGILRESFCDGLLVNYFAAVPPRLVSLLKEYHLPAVWMNVRFSEDCVYPDDRQAGQQLTEYLLALGHRRIAYADLYWVLGHDRGIVHYSKVDRRAGYEYAMQQAGLSSVCFLDESGWTWRERAAYAVDVLKQPDRPTAIVGYGPEADIFQRAAGRLGICVPEQLSLATFGDPGGSLDVAHYTQAHIPNYEMGKYATEMLLNKIDNPLVANPAIVLPAGLFVGYSSAPPGENNHLQV